MQGENHGQLDPGLRIIIIMSEVYLLFEDILAFILC